MLKERKNGLKSGERKIIGGKTRGLIWQNPLVRHIVKEVAYPLSKVCVF